jgi:CDP-diacylglycerol--glycerol-3-phosphate 3-phosphatidyltransferase
MKMPLEPFMPSIYQLKPAFQNLLRPLVKQLAAKKITPNQITIAALIMSILTGIGFIFWQSPRIWFFFPFISLGRMGLNAIDGMLAREHNLKTPLGTILNELGDVIADSALYLPFALLPQVSSLLIVLIVILSIISEMAGILGVITIGQRRYDGPMGKSDRAFFFSIIALLYAGSIALESWLNVVLTMILALLIGTIVNRIYHSLPLESDDLETSSP